MSLPLRDCDTCGLPQLFDYISRNQYPFVETGRYYVAEFREDGIEHEAWFDGTGKWVMTESNLRYSSLPQAIREQFEKSVYSTWKKDDIDKIERFPFILAASASNVSDKPCLCNTMIPLPALNASKSISCRLFLA